MEKDYTKGMHELSTDFKNWAKVMVPPSSSFKPLLDRLFKLEAAHAGVREANRMLRRSVCEKSEMIVTYRRDLDAYKWRIKAQQQELNDAFDQVAKYKEKYHKIKNQCPPNCKPEGFTKEEIEDLPPETEPLVFEFPGGISITDINHFPEPKEWEIQTGESMEQRAERIKDL